MSPSHAACESLDFIIMNLDYQLQMPKVNTICSDSPSETYFNSLHTMKLENRVGHMFSISAAILNSLLLLDVVVVCFSVVNIFVNV